MILLKYTSVGSLVMKLTYAGRIILAVVILTTMPYGIATLLGGPDYVFGGFLLNPIDGNSYLAKMYQGWKGAWQFSLPFTAETGNGSYIFLFYIALGHVARLIGFQVIWVFHLARLLASICLGISLNSFYQKHLPDKQMVQFAFPLAVFGAGLGWLALPFSYLTSDYWVAEAYPFLSAYANPHFPLSLALILWLFSLKEPLVSWRKIFVILLAVFSLSMILPFGVILTIVVIGGKVVWDYFATHKFKWQLLSCLLIGGMPVLVYQLALVYTDPLLHKWNAQNLTPSPPLWDFLVSFSPVLIAAGIGIKAAIKKNTESYRLLVTWAILGSLLIYIPIGLQRRFMLGLYIPLVALAIIGLYDLFGTSYRKIRRAKTFLFISSLPTVLIILVVGLFGAISHQESIYLTRGEIQALSWISHNTPQNALVLASPDMGLYVPAYTGRKVLYGHPFETVDADQRKSQVVSFFSGGWDDKKQVFLIDNRVDYLFLGPRENSLSDIDLFDGVEEIYNVDGVSLYKVAQAP
jgi:hypothetical protein